MSNCINFNLVKELKEEITRLRFENELLEKALKLKDEQLEEAEDEIRKMCTDKRSLLRKVETR